MCMYEVLKAGGLSGGFNFDAKNRRPSYTMGDMFHAYILGMDAFALAKPLWKSWPPTQKPWVHPSFLAPVTRSIWKRL